MDGAVQDGELQRLAQKVRAPRAVEPFAAYVFESNDPAAELARHVERTVFLEAFGNTPGLLGEEYGPYEPSSLFICIVDHVRHMPAGMMRVLLPSPRGFKSLNDIEPVWGTPARLLVERSGLTLSQATTWDIATLAVAREYRGSAAQGLVTMGLYQTLTLLARSCGIEWFVAILDMPVFRMIRWKLCLIFSGYDDVAPRPYLGSPASLPVWCNVAAAEQRLAESDEHLHEILVKGIGLEPGLRRVDLASVATLAAWPSAVAACSSA
jgi:hypothetical protein